MGFGQKRPYISVEVLLVPAWVSSQRPLAPSVISVTSVGDNEMIQGDLHRSPGIYLTAEENPGKL